ncbi:hypothetical protein F2Q69_00007022 [Brassica cretica]|uniref:Uncharacterized protein n=1 Tax=Brassica cretica TaxID=69181 RepID=A0A8S9NWI5_BRACR|nr:hypothetical protein F2Q69_00007022 [Brassica cretica]
MSAMHNLLVYMSQTAPTVAMKAFPSSREEFQLSLCPGDGSLLELGHYQSAPQEHTRVIDSSYQAWYYKISRITLLLQCNSLPHLLSDLMGHSLNVLFSLLGLSEEHPQPVGKLSLLKWLIHWDP